MIHLKRADGDSELNFAVNFKLMHLFFIFFDRASVCKLVHKTNVVHNFFLVYLPISTCFGQLWTHHNVILCG
jgi:hypothetical protein